MNWHIYIIRQDAAKNVSMPDDELILWFGDGPYVEKALELKMLYQPLNRAQEDKYRQFKQRKDGIVEVRPEDYLESGEIIKEPVQIKPVTTNAEKFNTVNLQEELPAACADYECHRERRSGRYHAGNQENCRRDSLFTAPTG